MSEKQVQAYVRKQVLHLHTLIMIVLYQVIICTSLQ